MAQEVDLLELKIRCDVKGSEAVDNSDLSERRDFYKYGKPIKDQIEQFIWNNLPTIRKRLHLEEQDYLVVARESREKYDNSIEYDIRLKISSKSIIYRIVSWKFTGDFERDRY